MTLMTAISQDEHKRLLGIEESFTALQKVYAQLTDRIARPPYIEPSEAEKNKRELEATLLHNQRLDAHCDRLRAAVNALVECL